MKLEQIRAYEREQGSKIPKEQRPVFHFTPDIGWMNDPNGFSLYKDQYHLFYQYNPYDIHWGPMHWGHSKTDDFIKWERLPMAMAPDKSYESGCFSGGAIELDDGQHMLIYTADLQVEQADGTKKAHQTQCVAYGDGVDYVKCEQNPVIDETMLPEGISAVDFRDPKIWKQDGRWYAIMCGKDTNGDGQILLYQSVDTKHWEYVKVFEQAREKEGKMWECPDFFEIEDTAVIIVSPMEMTPTKDLEFHNGHISIYLTGNYDAKSLTFTRQQVRCLDYGLDFYAPQSLLAKDGRRILIGWMQSWDNYMTPPDYKWSGMMTIPREVTVQDGILCQMPIREIENYHQNTVQFKDICVKGNEKLRLNQVNGRIVDFEVQVLGNDYHTFTVNVAEDEDYATSIYYNRDTKKLTFDRRYSGMKYDYIEQREVFVETEELLSLRILMDQYSVELFVNNGEKVMTSLIYTPMDAAGISFEADQDVTIHVKKSDIVVD